MALSHSYLLDTNIVVQLLRNDPMVKARLATAPTVFVSVISRGELYFWCAQVESHGRESSAGRRLRLSHAKPRL